MQRKLGMNMDTRKSLNFHLSFIVLNNNNDLEKGFLEFYSSILNKYKHRDS